MYTHVTATLDGFSSRKTRGKPDPLVLHTVRRRLCSPGPALWVGDAFWFVCERELILCVSAAGLLTWRVWTGLPGVIGLMGGSCMLQNLGVSFLFGGTSFVRRSPCAKEC